MKLSNHLYLDEGFGLASIWLTLFGRFFRRFKTVFVNNIVFGVRFPLLTIRTDERAGKLFKVFLLDTEWKIGNL